MLNEPLSIVGFIEEQRKRLARSALVVPLLRAVYLGHARSALMLSPKRVPSDEWDWLPDQKRWRSSIIEKREFMSLPTYRSEAAAMAVNYFADSKAGREEELARLVTSLRSRTAKVAILILCLKRLFKPMWRHSSCASDGD